MAEHISRDEYIVHLKESLGSAARDMLNGTLSFLEGARRVTSLGYEAGLTIEDSDFVVFVGIASEADDLPMGDVRQYWSVEALARQQPVLESRERWARDYGMKACQALVYRFGSNPTFQRTALPPLN